MDQEWTDEMAARLREAREERGLGRVSLAARAGVSERTIIDLENNRRAGRDGPVRPRRSTVIRIVHALRDQQLSELTGVQPDWTTESPRGGHLPSEQELVDILVKHLTPAIREIRELFAHQQKPSDP